MANTTPEPWVPEGADASGTPPTSSGPGERGTSAYEGDGASDERGPLIGIDNYSEVGRSAVPTSGVEVNVREAASTDE